MSNFTPVFVQGYNSYKESYRGDERDIKISPELVHTATVTLLETKTGDAGVFHSQGRHIAEDKVTSSWYIEGGLVYLNKTGEGDHRTIRLVHESQEGLAKLAQTLGLPAPNASADNAGPRTRIRTYFPKR